MNKSEAPMVLFIKDVMRRRKLLPSQLAAELGISHTTVGRWLSGKEAPSIKSWLKLANYIDMSLEEILSQTGYLPKMNSIESSGWPEFREYAQAKYHDELDEDLVAMIEDLIERRRKRKKSSKKVSAQK